MEELVSVQEVAVMLRVTRQRVDQLARRADFPGPVANLSAGRVWLKADILAWAQATGRLDE